MKDKINKLPKWAKELIESLERERETAIRALNEYIDNETVSPFFTDDLICTGEEKGPSFKKRYIQAHSITVNYADVSLQIYLRNKYIQIKWENANNRSQEIALIPDSYMSARLVKKENMS